MILLLIIIYMAFISLGLPDSLLGSAWPSMYENFGVSISNAGIISMIIAGGTIISSLFSNKLIYKFGTGLVTLISVAMTAIALLFISFSNSFILICIWAVPLGLGAGSVDAALNNFVALHYKAIHMNLLHCFWGVGASIGPIIISFFLTSSDDWQLGYRTISIIQFLLVFILTISLPIWKKVQIEKNSDNQSLDNSNFSLSKLIKLNKSKPTLIAFFCYCSIEATVGLWGSSYLVIVRNIPKDIAARWLSIYFIGITIGRLFSGFLSIKFTQKQLIKLGQFLIALGILMLVLPLNTTSMLGLFFIGIGCAPIYPSLLHETPNTFGKEYSQAIMGIQMASAYVGTTFIPPLFGLITHLTGYGLFPIYISIFLIIMIVMVNKVYRK